MSRRDIPFESPDNFKWTDIPVGLLFTIALASISVALIILIRPFYYLNITWLSIDSVSGFNSYIIKENYNSLVSYLVPFGSQDLMLPSLRISETGLLYIGQVRSAITILYLAGAVSIVLCILSFIIKDRQNEYKFYRNSAIISAAFAVIFAAGSLINFDAVLFILRKILFTVERPVDAVADPLFTMLPKEYLFECMMIVCGFLLIGALVMFILFLVKKKKHKDPRLMPRKTNYYY